jgi:hypothetical protein
MNIANHERGLFFIIVLVLLILNSTGVNQARGAVVRNCEDCPERDFSAVNDSENDLNAGTADRCEFKEASLTLGQTR